MSAYDVEIIEERELQVLELFAALNDENEDEDLPPIIQDELPNWYDWGEAAYSRPFIYFEASSYSLYFGVISACPKGEPPPYQLVQSSRT